MSFTIFSALIFILFCSPMALAESTGPSTVQSDSAKLDEGRFRAYLQTLTPEQRLQAMEERREAQFKAYLERLSQQHRIRMADLYKNLGQDPALSDEEKQKKIQQAEKEFAKKIENLQKSRERTQSQSRLGAIKGNPNLSPEEKRKQMRDLIKNQRSLLEITDEPAEIGVMSNQEQPLQGNSGSRR